MDCVVARDRDAVFEFLADIRNEKRWNPRVLSIEKVSDGDIGAGTRFRGTYRGLGSLDTQLNDFEPPGRLSFVSRGPRMHIDGTFLLTAGQEGTIVSLEAQLKPKGTLRFAAPIMAPVLRRQNLAAGVRLKAALEQYSEPD